MDTTSGVLSRGPRRNGGRGTKHSGSPGRTAPHRRWAAESANAAAAKPAEASSEGKGGGEAMANTEAKRIGKDSPAARARVNGAIADDSS